MVRARSVCEEKSAYPSRSCGRILEPLKLPLAQASRCGSADDKFVHLCWAASRFDVDVEKQQQIAGKFAASERWKGKMVFLRLKPSFKYLKFLWWGKRDCARASLNGKSTSGSARGLGPKIGSSFVAEVIHIVVEGTP